MSECEPGSDRTSLQGMDAAEHSHQDLELADEDGIVPLCAWAAHPSWTRGLLLGCAGCKEGDRRVDAMAI